MTTTTKPKPATLDHLKKKKKPWQDVYICLEPDLKTASDKATTELASCEARLASLIQRSAPEGELATVREELEAARKEADAAEEKLVKATVRMRVEALGRKKYDALVEKHPPTDEQTAQFRAENPQPNGEPGIGVPDYNPDTFPHAVIAATLTQPKMTAEEVAEVTEDWNFNEFMQLFMASMAVCSASRVEAWGNSFG